MVYTLIRSHLNEKQRKAVKPEFLVKLMRMATKRIHDSFLRSLQKSPIHREVKKILRGLAWKLTAMARTKAIWKTTLKYKTFPEMKELRQVFKLMNWPRALIGWFLKSADLIGHESHRNSTNMKTLIRKRMASKRAPIPEFDDKWNMEMWAWVTRLYKPIANKNEIVENFTKEFDRLWNVFVPFFLNIRNCRRC